MYLLGYIHCTISSALTKCVSGSMQINHASCMDQLSHNTALHVFLHSPSIQLRWASYDPSIQDHRTHPHIPIIIFMFVLPSIRDVVAGRRITIVRTDADEVYYFGLYDDQSHTNATPLVGSLYPRDLMAKGRRGQDTFGAVSLGCDDSETAVTVGDAVAVASDSETAVTVGDAVTVASKRETAVKINVSISVIIRVTWHYLPLRLQQHSSGILL